MKSNTLKNNLIPSILGLFLVFLLWFFLYFIVSNNHLIPSPLIVIKESFLNLLNPDFYSHLLNTLLRVLIAIIISFLLGVSLAVFSHLNSNFEGIILPFVSIIRSLPVLAILLIILVCLPRGVAPIIVCVLSVLPICYTQTLNYLNSIDSKQKEVLKIYNVSLKTQIFSVYLKGYTPLFIKEITALFSFSLKLVVSAEILANVYKSLGGDISNASIYSNVVELFSLTLIICIIGIAVETIGKLVCYNMEKKYK